MKKVILWVTLTGLFFVSGLGQTTPIETDWKELFKNEDAANLRAARTTAYKILQKAREQNKAQDWVNAVFYIMKYQGALEDASIADSLNIDFLKGEIPKSNFPVNAILQNTLAHTYESILGRRYWDISGVNESNTPISDNYQTWGVSRFFKEISALYLSSVSNKNGLKDLMVKDYSGILLQVPNSKELSFRYRPTMYDILAHHALDFFRNDRYDIIPRPIPYLSPEILVTDTRTFLTTDFAPSDSASARKYSAEIYKNLLNLHISRKDTFAMILADLERLDDARDGVAYQDKKRADSLYLSALQKLAKLNNEHPAVTDVYSFMARFYADRGRNYMYNSNKEDSIYNQDFVRANRVCEEAIKRYPTSHGTMVCKLIQQEINEKKMELSFKEVSPSMTTIPIKVFQRNTQQIWFRLLPFNTITANLKPEGFAKQTALQSWSETFETSDFRPHSKEISIGAIAEGEYWLAISDNADFNTKNGTVQAIHFYVNDIAYYYIDDPMYYHLYFADRKTGKPLEGMQAIRHYYSDENTTVFTQDSTYSTDNKGHFSFVKPLYSGNSALRYKFAFRSGTETLVSDINISEEDYESWSIMSDLSLVQDKKKKKGTKDPGISPQTENVMPIYEEEMREYYDYGGEIQEQGIMLFSDRKIYRPGQTVYLKAIPYNRANNTFIPIKEDTFKVTYGENLAEHILITNRFGSFSDSIVLPKNVSGEMSVMVEWIQDGLTSRKYFGRLTLNIEEYKRPKFYTETTPIKEEAAIGDEITFRGKSVYYAGVPLRGARVEARVEYKHYQGRYWEGNNILSSFTKTVETDQNGEFSIVVPPIKTDTIKDLSSLYVILNAKISEPSGEFYELEKTVVLTKESIRLSANFPEYLNKSALPKVKISVKNIDDQSFPKSGTIDFYLIPPDEKESYSVDITKMTKTASVDFSATELETFIPNILANQQVGKYEYLMRVADKSGDTVRLMGSFILWDSTSNESPFTQEVLWSYIPHKQAIAGSTITHYLYTQKELMYLNYFIVKDKRVLYSAMQEIKAGRNMISVPLNESWEGAFSVEMVTIKNNEVLTFKDNFNVISQNHTLKVKWASFRNKLVPGAKEEWKLNVSALSTQGPASAEVLALMYDKSLDAIRFNGWYIPSFSNQDNDVYRYDYYRDFIKQGAGFETLTPYFTFVNRNPVIPNAAIYFAALNYYAVRSVVAIGKEQGRKGEKKNPILESVDKLGEMSMDSAPAPAAVTSGADFAVMEKDADGIPDVQVEQIDIPSSPESKEGKQSIGVQGVEIKKEKIVRTNLKETAFFLPHLETNAEGDVLINFDSPEALTQWKFAAFAHTEDGKCGELQETEIFTQKPMMVMPNNPRFVRMGDNMKFTATVINQSGKDLNGKAKIQFTEMISGQDVTAKLLNGGNSEVSFIASANQNAPLVWAVTIPKEVSALTYQVIAQAGDFADGEENALPVLTDDVLITESLPLFVKSKETKTFILPGLRESFTMNRGIRNSLFTLEFAENPAWYALQSMPYLMEFPHECSEQLFSRYYANALSSHVLNSTPLVKSVLEKWAQASDNKAGILDLLSKNEELKSAMLQETPWVFNGKQDDWKKRLGMLMDMQKMGAEMEKAEKTLWERQNNNGSFSWFPGGQGNAYITRLLLEGFGHLNKLGVKNSEVVIEKMQKAIDYSDDIVRNNYKEAKKEGRKEEYIASVSDIQALYVRSFYPDVKVSDPDDKAYTFFTESAVKNVAKYTPYAQAMLALTLHRKGESARAKTILDGLKNSAVRDKEDGISWNEKGGYYWYESAVETQALVAEAFDEVYGDKEIVNQVKNWMLRKKRNRSWETTTATVAACNLLFLTGENMLESSPQTDYKFGGQFFSPSDKGVADDGTGYVKVSWNADEIKPEMAEWTLTKNSTGNGYGALYWQYFQPIYMVSNATSGLSVKKTYLVERYGNKIPLSEGMSLQANDKVFVKIEFSTGRDMEYVHLKDLRAGCFEPVEQLSSYKFNGKIGYYQSNRDVATHFFIDFLPKGDHLIEYELKTYYKGSFSSGITTIQSMYAPEFNAHSSGSVLKVE